MARRERIEPTDDWQKIKPRCEFAEEEYEEIRPLVRTYGVSSTRRDSTGSSTLCVTPGLCTGEFWVRRG